MNERESGKFTTIPIEKRFWPKVNKSDECWTWTGYIKESGYGQLWFGGRVQGAHRVSWQIHNGPIPEGMQVCHKCDNPPCVRPDHLFLGTQVDNSKDMKEKGRSPSCIGEKNSRAILSESDVIEIRRLRSLGMKRCHIHARFSCFPIHAVDDAMYGIRWTHIPTRPDDATVAKIKEAING